MRVTIDEAADIYARACVAWYGARALPIVWQHVQMMQKRGDKSGVEAWTKVALALKRMQPTTDSKPRRLADLSSSNPIRLRPSADPGQKQDPGERIPASGKRD